MNTRRSFLKTLAAGSGAALLGLPAFAQTGAGQKVVIVGGGTGGATAARYLKRALPQLEVVLIERDPSYLTCYLSNEVLSGSRDLETLRHGYTGLAAAGVVIRRGEVIAIDADNHVVLTAAGETINFDRCIVSPGIDFQWETIEGYDAAVAESLPHAWKAGDQTLTLRAQLESMDDGGTVLIGAPPNPYRCPPAPYERASQIAMYLKREKPASKVIILDPKSGFAKQLQFEEAWGELYGYATNDALIEWRSGEEQRVTAVDPVAGTVRTAGGETLSGAVINPIPAQKAGPIAFAAGLTDASGWCPVNPLTFESELIADIHVIGDACTVPSLPKSGYAANAQAKACAASVAALLTGAEPPNPSFSNACYSVISEEWAISILAIYRLADDGRSIQAIPGAGGASPLAASDRDRRVAVDYAYAWYRNFTLDVFG